MRFGCLFLQDYWPSSSPKGKRADGLEFERDPTPALCHHAGGAAMEEPLLTKEVGGVSAVAPLAARVAKGCC